MRHYLRYVNASVLVIVAGMVSFPVIARSLTFEQLGILGYFEAIIVFLTSALKFGTQHSALRFYPSYHRGDRGPDSVYYTNFVLMPTVLTLIVGALGAIAIWLVYGGDMAADGGYWMIALALGVAGAMLSTLNSVWMAQERSGAASILQVVARWATLVLVILAILFVGSTAMNVFLARLVVALIVAGYALAVLWRIGKYLLRDIDWSVMKDSWGYGIPLVVNELLWTALEVTDRIMLRHLGPGLEAVGVLTIGSGLARYVIVLMLYNVRSAFEPVVNRLFENDGPSAVRGLKQQINSVMTYVSVLLAVGIGLAGDELFVLFAGADKAESARIFQAVSIIFVVYSWLSMVAYGLKLYRRTGVLLGTRVAAFAVNLAMNLVLIPTMGVWGAVLATAVSFIFAGVLEIWYCPPELKISLLEMPWARAVGWGMLLGVAGFALDQFWVWNELLFLTAICGLSLMVFVWPVMTRDPDIRKAVDRLVAARRR